MTKTDYELTIGGKLRKVYKNSGGFFVKMNGGNLDVNEYFLKNGGGLKSKYKNKNKDSSKGKNKKKITGGYPIFLIKNNQNLKKAVIGFMNFNGDSSVQVQVLDIDFKSDISDIDNKVKSIVEDIIKFFYKNENSSTADSSTRNYKVKTPGLDDLIPLPLNDVTNTNDDSENIQNDIKNFYKMYILYYFFKNYNERSEEREQQNRIVINNYTNFLSKAEEIKVNSAPAPASASDQAQDPAQAQVPDQDPP